MTAPSVDNNGILFTADGSPISDTLGGLAVTSSVGTFSNTLPRTVSGRAITSSAGTMASNPRVTLHSVSATTGHAAIAALTVSPVARLFIIAGIHQANIAPGIAFYPTSENVSLPSNHYVAGSSPFYRIGWVYWSGVQRTQGTDWQFVTPGNHPTYTHIIQILNPPANGTTITLVYNSWDIKVSDNFIVTSYPVTFSFYNTSIIADSMPPLNQNFAVQVFKSRPFVNPQSLFAHFPVIYDDMLPVHTVYDTTSGFETYRPVGYQIFNSTFFHLYTWSGSGWQDGGVIPDPTTFYVKRTRAIYQYSGGIITTLYTAGDGASAIPQVLTYPLFGEGVAYNTLKDGVDPNAASLYPAAYEIHNSPGDYDSWVKG